MLDWSAVDFNFVNKVGCRKNCCIIILLKNTNCFMEAKRSRTILPVNGLL